MKQVAQQEAERARFVVEKVFLFKVYHPQTLLASINFFHGKAVKPWKSNPFLPPSRQSNRSRQPSSQRRETPKLPCSSPTPWWRLAMAWWNSVNWRLPRRLLSSSRAPEMSPTCPLDRARCSSCLSDDRFPTSAPFWLSLAVPRPLKEWLEELVQDSKLDTHSSHSFCKPTMDWALPVAARGGRQSERSVTYTSAKSSHVLKEAGDKSTYSSRNEMTMRSLLHCHSEHLETKI